MPIGDIAGELLGGLLRIAGQIVSEIVLEYAVRWPGYLICRLFSREVDREGGKVLLVGLVFWVLIVVIGYFSYVRISNAVAVDRCLDWGGSFNYQSKECLRTIGK